MILERGGGGRHLVRPNYTIPQSEIQLAALGTRGFAQETKTAPHLESRSGADPVCRTPKPNQPTSSVPAKKKAISIAAFSALSEPWTALRPLFSA